MEWLKYNIEVVKQILSALGIIVGAFGFPSLVSALTALVGYLQKNTTESIISTTLIAALVASLISILFLVYYTIKMRNRYQAVSPLFLQTAHDNKACDEQLFNKLFLEAISAARADRGIASAEPAIEAALQITSQNIASTTEHACRVFTVRTGAQCAAALKMRTKDDLIETIYRDQNSKNARGTGDDRAYNIFENTAYSKIIIGQKPYYVCDDLIKARKKELYSNPRPNWSDDYTATVVIPVFFDLEQTTYNAFLCIDNKSGGFNNKESLNYASEFAARLTVMSFRLTALRELSKEIRRGRGNHDRR